MLAPGSTFAGYSILDRLNQGGMADIYVATDRVGRKVILRILLPEHHFHWRSLRRFRWGCQVLAKLEHPNVVRLYGAGDFKGRPFAILELVDGPNLKEKILRSDAALQTHRLKLLVEMAGGLSYIHQKGFLHLDFKPENVLVNHEQAPKIIDLDLSIPRPETPKRVAVLAGTLAYLAPEQIAKEPVDERADIFAYGVTAYEMVTGHKPITGNSRGEILQKYAQFNLHVKPPRHYAPDLPAFIETVILKCLEKDVSRRYPSLQLVLRDLQK